MLNIALPNGTLEERVTELFTKAGIELGRTSRCYQAVVNDPRIARVTFMRPQIIPLLVERGSYDLAIVGSDVVAEAGKNIATLAKLNCSARGGDREFRIVLFGERNDPAQSIRDIEPNSTILSEYPSTTLRALRRAEKLGRVSSSFGATEAHIPHDFKYGVCITSTEETLNANGLKIIQVLSVETTVIVGGWVHAADKEKERLKMSLIDDFVKVSP